MPRSSIRLAATALFAISANTLPWKAAFADTTTTAQNVSDQDWLDCRAIQDSANRLACFDAAAKAAAPAEDKDNTATADAGKGPPPSQAKATGGNDDKAKDQVPALNARLAEERAGESNAFALRAYKPNYILLASYTPTDLSRPVYDFKPRHAESKFQLSFQFNWWNRPFGPNTAFFMTYTQVSFWQVYDSKIFGSDASAPFRETDYEPEVGLDITTNYHLAGLDFRKLRFSFIHQSNGQGGARSRSWNRLAFTTGFGRGHFLGALRAWYRIPEDPASDDNPDITDYLGYGDLLLAYKWHDQTFAMTLRNNLQENNRGSVKVSYSFPLSKRVKGYVQYFNGYGESLIDYNRSVSRIGVGIALTDWL